jgi:hypothetical protein
MSKKVKERLLRMRIETTAEERAEIDRLITERTGEKDCDTAVQKLSDEEFRQIVEEAKKRIRERKKIVYAYY